MEELFKQKARNIKILIKKQTITDPYEKNTENINIMYLPIKAIVADLTTTKAQYAMVGIVTDSAKELTIKKSDKNKLDLSSYIFIDGETYVGWRSGTKLQYRETDDREYIRVYCYIKKTN